MCKTNDSRKRTESQATAINPNQIIRFADSQKGYNFRLHFVCMWWLILWCHFLCIPILTHSIHFYRHIIKLYSAICKLLLFILTVSDKDGRALNEDFMSCERKNIICYKGVAVPFYRWWGIGNSLPLGRSCHFSLGEVVFSHADAYWSCCVCG